MLGTRKIGLMKPKIVTIGVYGYDEDGFFKALTDAGVDTFCDVRQRRGMRGAKYAFVNSNRLQERLQELGIRYFHFRHLAPSQTVRELQKAADLSAGTGKRTRLDLSDEFAKAYYEECLVSFEAEEFIKELGEDAKVVALFCVEREPAACHRSLVAQRLAQDLELDIYHIMP